MTISNLDKNKNYLLACSFGPDSMALFYLLLKEKYNFEVAFVNYHLREESDLEEKGIEEFCNTHKIRLHKLSVSEKIDTNVEKKCRDIRYRFFSEIVKRYELSGVLVAQHMDDHIETFLLQKKRKILPNCWGISPKNTIFDVEIIRPLLNYTKEDLLSICRDNNIPYAIDKTNLSDQYARNRIRHEIVERLSREEKDELVLKIQKENDSLNTLLSSIDQKKINDVSYVLSLDEVTYLYLINICARRLDSSLFISKEQGKTIRKVLESHRPNIFVLIKRGLYVSKQYNEYSFYTSETIGIVSYSVLIDHPQEFECEYFYLDFRGDTSNRNVKLDDYPLTIKNAKKSDRYIIKDYSCSVRRLFIDWKVPEELRNRWPVILNKEGNIIYIPRYQSNFTKSKDCNFYVKY